MISMERLQPQGKEKSGMRNKIQGQTFKITLNEYLSKYNRQRKFDNIIRKWFNKKEKMNVLKRKEEWEQIISSFWKETER
jgi:hypothetical protein